MRKTLWALSALAAVAITASAANRTEAAPLGNPAGLAGAVDELAIVDNVHCRPGWRHHNPNNWRRADGCARRGGGASIHVVPGRSRYVVRDGVRVRVGSGHVRDRDRTTVRSRTDIRSRTNVNVREGSGRREGGADVNVRQRGGGSATTQGRGGQRDGGGAAIQGGGGQKGGGAMQKGSGGQRGGGGQGGGAGQGGEGTQKQ